jgi:hypothetical protein
MALIAQLDAKIYLALITRLKLMPGGYAIVEPGQTYPTTGNVPFILVQDVRFDPVARYVGNSEPDEHRGLFSIAVMTPLDWTHTQGMGIAGAIRSHMPKGASYSNGGATVQILQTPSAGTAYRDGAWNRLPVSVRWRCSG